MRVLSMFLFLIGVMSIATAGLAAGPPIFETPDNVSLSRGAKSIERGYYDDAMRHFKRAATYGNKQAQKVIGMLYLTGGPVKRDWALGYAWLKLASSHGDPEYIQARDEVWAQLKPSEKRRTEREFERLNKRYGDAIALERREEWVRKQKRELTGSRTGSSAALTVQVSDASGFTWRIAGPIFFDMLQGTYIEKFQVATGEVELGEFKVVEDEEDS